MGDAALKKYFPLPNDIYNLGLCAEEIAIYGYLLSIEDRRTFTCYPSYKTIGRAVGMSGNTVRKYVSSLVDKGFIYTEPTKIVSKEQRKMNGSLLYTIRPISEARELYYAGQLQKLEADAKHQRIAKRLAREGVSA